MEKTANIIKASVALFLIILFLIFCFQNIQKVDIGFIFFKLEQTPLFVALFGVFAIGTFVGFLLGLLSNNKKMQKQLDKANEN